MDKNSYKQYLEKRKEKLIELIDINEQEHIFTLSEVFTISAQLDYILKELYLIEL